MLHWGRKNPNSFYQQMLPKAMAAASKEVDRSGPDADGASDAAFEEVMRMMRAAAGRPGLTSPVPGRRSWPLHARAVATEK